MIIYCDIDNTICKTDGCDYANAVPINEHIHKINGLYDRGHKITYWTARGSGTGKDWSVITVKQLKEWGVKYHGVEFGKPLFDLFIDDRAINAKAIQRIK